MDTRTALRSLAALSHQNRLAIFRLLVEQGPGGIAAGRIAERLGLPAATASFHLKELVNAQMAIARPQSRFIYYGASYGAMNDLIAYLTENCCRAGGVCPTGCAPVVHHTDEARPSSASRRSGKAAKRRAA